MLLLAELDLVLHHELEVVRGVVLCAGLDPDIDLWLLLLVLLVVLDQIQVFQQLHLLVEVLVLTQQVL